MAHLTARQARKKEVQFQGRALCLYSVGWLAYACKRHPETIKHWERTKILPGPLLQSGSKWRYYTADEIVTYSSIFRAHSIGSGCRYDRQALIGAFLAARKNLVRQAKEQPESLRAKLSNETALLKYAADLLESRANATIDL